jgi:hypothetical protein
MTRKMNCNNPEKGKKLLELVYGSLPEADQDEVKQHIALCRVCQEEYEVLLSLKNTAIPDPGEAFWSSLPSEVVREGKSQSRQKWLGWNPLHLWAWWSGLGRAVQGGLAVAAVALAIFILLVPGSTPVIDKTLDTAKVGLSDPVFYIGSDTGLITVSEVDLVKAGQALQLAMDSTVYDELFKDDGVSIKAIDLQNMDKETLGALEHKIDRLIPWS